jgi:transcriptional regulator with XRE-family HTH domain
MSLGRLARASGLSKGFISQVEHGRSQPSLDSLGRIASSLDVSLHSLLGSRESAEANPPGPGLAQLFRLRPGRNSKTVVEVLLVDSAGTLAVAYLARGASVTPAEDEGTAEAAGRGQSPPVRALCVVIDGEAVFVQDGVEQLLEQGDALSWDAARSYRVENRAQSVCALLFSIGAGGEVPLARLPAQPAGAPIERMPAAAPVALVPVEGPLRLVAMRAERRGRGR